MSSSACELPVSSLLMASAQEMSVSLLMTLSDGRLLEGGERASAMIDSAWRRRSRAACSPIFATSSSLTTLSVRPYSCLVIRCGARSPKACDIVAKAHNMRDGRASSRRMSSRVERIGSDRPAHENVLALSRLLTPFFRQSGIWSLF